MKLKILGSAMIFIPILLIYVDSIISSFNVGDKVGACILLLGASYIILAAYFVSKGSEGGK